MLPDPREIAPPTSPDELLPKIFGRAAELRRQQRRRRWAVRTMAPAIVLLLLGAALALRADDEPLDGRLRTEQSTTTSSVVVTDGPGPTVPAPAPFVGDGAGLAPAPGSLPPEGQSSTTVTDRAPELPQRVTITFDRRSGTQHQAVLLRPGSDRLESLAPTDAENQVADLSPDRRLVAYQSEAANLLAGLHTITEVYVRDLTSGQVRQLTSTPLDDGHGSQFPRWSPDGRQIGFNCAPNSVHAVCVMQADGSGIRVLSDPNLRLYAPSWSSDGRSLVALRSETGRTGDLWLVPVDGTPVRRINKAPLHLDRAWFGPGDRSVRLAEPRSAVERVIVSVDVTTGERQELSTLPAAYLAPCGPHHVVYVAARAHGAALEGDVVLSDLAGRSARVVLRPPEGTTLDPSSCRIG